MTATPQRYVPDVQTVHRLLLQRAGLAPQETQLEPSPAAPTTPEAPSIEQTATPQTLPESQPAAVEPLETAHLPFADLLEDLQILGQLRNTFIVASTRKGLVIIDQ
ncbi:MAG: hypothetical protein RMM10_13335, partial [Anaerolineae bacterium]